MLQALTKAPAPRLTPKEKGMILGGIRTAFSRSKWAANIRATAEAVERGPRGGKLYSCQTCSNLSNASGVNVDHIDPVVDIGKTYHDYTWDELVGRLWCDTDNLQVLCKQCHKKKSKDESNARRQARAEAKQRDLDAGL